MNSTTAILRLLKQTAVYWGSPIPNGTGGFTYSDPVEVVCRWEDKKETILTNEGDTIISNSMILSITNMDEQGYLYLGELDDLNSTDVPFDLEDCRQIVMKHKVPTVNAKAILYKYMLK